MKVEDGAQMAKRAEGRGARNEGGESWGGGG